VIRQVLRSRYRVRSFLLTGAKLDELGPAIEAAAVTAPIYLVTTEQMVGIIGFGFHRGALASVERPGSADPDTVVPRDARLVAVLEDMSDNENLGALFRNAAAFGVDAVLLSPGCADPLYRRSVRVSMGHVLHVPWARLEPWPDRLEGVRALGFRVVALTPDATAVLSDLAPGPATVVMVGAEGPGLSRAALAAADVRVRIPMAAGVDSLNVATAAAIAFHALSGNKCP
jgi:tRNA G18 (ribose-2'-O)-methylase SpoU